MSPRRTFGLALGLALVIAPGIGGCAPPPQSTPAAAPVAVAVPAAAVGMPAATESKPREQVVVVGEGARRYSMEDLTALERDGSHRELIVHAEDVPPADRNEAWKKLVEGAALGTVAGETDPEMGLGIAEELRKRFPSLTASRAFVTKRNDLAIASATVCYETPRRDGGAPCTERLHELVKTDAAEPAFAMAAGRLVIRKQFNYVAVRFFRHAVIDRPTPNRACSDPDLLRAIEAALENSPEDHAIHKDAAAMKQLCKKR